MRINLDVKKAVGYLKEGGILKLQKAGVIEDKEKVRKAYLALFGDLSKPDGASVYWKNQKVDIVGGMFNNDPEAFISILYGNKKNYEAAIKVYSEKVKSDHKKLWGNPNIPNKIPYIEAEHQESYNNEARNHAMHNPAQFKAKVKALGYKLPLPTESSIEQGVRKYMLEKVIPNTSLSFTEDGKDMVKVSLTKADGTKSDVDFTSILRVFNEGPTELAKAYKNVNEPLSAKKSIDKFLVFNKDGSVTVKAKAAQDAGVNLETAVDDYFTSRGMTGAEVKGIHYDYKAGNVPKTIDDFLIQDSEVTMSFDAEGAKKAGFTDPAKDLAAYYTKKGWPMDNLDKVISNFETLPTDVKSKISSKSIPDPSKYIETFDEPSKEKMYDYKMEKAAKEYPVTEGKIKLRLPYQEALEPEKVENWKERVTPESTTGNTQITQPNPYTIKDEVITYDASLLRKDITPAEIKELGKQAFKEYEALGGNIHKVKDSNGRMVTYESTLMVKPIKLDKPPVDGGLESIEDATSNLTEPESRVEKAIPDKLESKPDIALEKKAEVAPVSKVETTSTPDTSAWITNYDSKYHYINDGGVWKARRANNPDAPIFELAEGSLAVAKLNEFMKSKRWDDKATSSTIALEGGKASDTSYKDKYGSSEGKWPKKQEGGIISRVYKTGGKIKWV